MFHKMFHVFHENVPRGTKASRGAQDGCQLTTLEKLERHQLSEFGRLTVPEPQRDLLVAIHSGGLPKRLDLAGENHYGLNREICDLSCPVTTGKKGANFRCGRFVTSAPLFPRSSSEATQDPYSLHIAKTCWEAFWRPGRGLPVS